MSRNNEPEGPEFSDFIAALLWYGGMAFVLFLGFYGTR